MDQATRNQFLHAWRGVPLECRSAPATEDEIAAFEGAWGAMPLDFRWFLLACGGGPCGAEWVDGIKELWASHAKFRAESRPGGWTMQGVFIIGWDGGGNPFGIDRSTGAVVVEDHDFGGKHVMAESFEEFLRNGLSTGKQAG